MLPFLLLATLAADRFVSVTAGVVAVSGDAGTVLVPSTVTASLYKPENGPAVNVSGGIHFNDWVSAQLSYGWNRNPIELQGIRGPAFFAWPQSLSQNAVVGDAMMYFRPRSSRIRPYLSTGLAAIRFDRTPQGTARQSGEIPLPSAAAVNWRPGLRVAVGIDIFIHRGWGFRYSFGETLSKNPVSRSLVPPAPRNLANFQNLFGVVKYF